jgi:hypothetical protein
VAPTQHEHDMAMIDHLDVVERRKVQPSGDVILIIVDYTVQH